MDREKVIKGLEDSFANQGCGYMDGVGELYAVSGEDLQNALVLLKEQEEREKAICKEICDFIRGACSTDTDDDKDFVCYEIQKCFTRGR